MDSQSLLNIMTGAVVVSALALLFQACLLGVIVHTIRRTQARIDELTPRAESLMVTAEKTLVDSKKRIDEVTSKAADILESTQKQIQRSDEFLTETTERARIQLDRLELVLDDTISRVHQTAVLINNGIVRPVRELTGIASGVRAAVDFFLRGGRPSVDKATSDEEMFI